MGVPWIGAVGATPVVPGQLSDRALLVGRSAERSSRHLRGRMSARFRPGPPGTLPGSLSYPAVRRSSYS